MPTHATAYVSAWAEYIYGDEGDEDHVCSCSRRLRGAAASKNTASTSNTRQCKTLAGQVPGYPEHLGQRCYDTLPSRKSYKASKQPFASLGTDSSGTNTFCTKMEEPHDYGCPLAEYTSHLTSAQAFISVRHKCSSSENSRSGIDVVGLLRHNNR